jgi:hypothetical protein
MRLSIYDLFTVGVARPDGGWSKGRPIAFLEEDDKCVPLFDLLIPNDLDDDELAWFVSDKFAEFACPGKRVVQLDDVANRRRGRVVNDGRHPRIRWGAALRRQAADSTAAGERRTSASATHQSPEFCPWRPFLL